MESAGQSDATRYPSLRRTLVGTPGLGELGDWKLWACRITAQPGAGKGWDRRTVQALLSCL